MALIRNSIRGKFLALIVALLLSAVLIYLAIAINLFESDKTAYIFDSNNFRVRALVTETETVLANVKKSLIMFERIITQATSVPEGLSQHRDVLRSIFVADPNVVHIEIRAPPSSPAAASHSFADGFDGVPRQWTKQEVLKSYRLDSEFWQRIAVARPVSIEAVLAKGWLIQNATLPDGPPLLALGKRLGADSGFAIVAYMRYDQLLEIFASSETSTNYLLDPAGTVIAHSQSELIAAGTNLADTKVVQSAHEQTTRFGTTELKSQNGENLIASFGRLPNEGLLVVSEISKDKAFLAMHRLMRKSILFAALIIVVSLLISAVFTKKLTTSIRKLYSATQKVAQGDFDVRVKQESQDEVGALAHSFNQMTDEITKLMAEVADKARMEQELETARLVQENLFPRTRVEYPQLDIASYYQPASECGGDWCYYSQIGSKVVVLVGDATGHGVPSALVTAAAQSCWTTLLTLTAAKNYFPLGPHQVMRFLNRSVYEAAKGNVKMTFQVSIVDLEKGEISYANASHEIAIVFRPRLGKKPKRKVLADHSSPCLGASPNQEFEFSTEKLEPGDILVWYTDGLLELRDESEDEWGEMRFIKTVSRVLDHDPESICGETIESALGFCSETGRDDDITLLVARYGEVNSSQEVGEGAA